MDKLTLARKHNGWRISIEFYKYSDERFALCCTEYGEQWMTREETHEFMNKAFQKYNADTRDGGYLIAPE